MKKVTTYVFVLIMTFISLNIEIVMANEYDEYGIKLDDYSIEMINAAINNYEDSINSIIIDTTSFGEQKNAIDALLQK